MSNSYLDLLFLLAPELAIVITALAIITSDLFCQNISETISESKRHQLAFCIMLFGNFIAIILIIFGGIETESSSQWLNLKGVGTIKISLIILSSVSLAISNFKFNNSESYNSNSDSDSDSDNSNSDSDSDSYDYDSNFKFNNSNSFTRHIGEFYLIALFALVGMMLMVSANHLLLAFVALEGVSLSFYTLVAMHRQRPESSEAALKYFLIGGVSAAFTLLGMSFLYGVTNEMSFDAIAEQLSEVSLSPLLIVAMGAITIGFGFKIAAVPMHLWAPDVYQVSAPSVAAMIASASKLAGFYLFARIWTHALGDLFGEINHTFSPGWFIMLSALIVGSIILGNLAAISQSSIKRLLAYSAIAHAGYVMIGLLAGTAEGIASMLYYLITYGLAVSGVFAMIALIEKNKGNDHIRSFSNLHKTHPIESFCLLIFLLSLAGIPPLAGFFGKFYLFISALKSPSTNTLTFWLVIGAISMSAISLYYYLQILKQVYVLNHNDHSDHSDLSDSSNFSDSYDHSDHSDSSEFYDSHKFVKDHFLLLIVVLLAIGIVILGCFPESLITSISSDLPDLNL